MFKCFIAALLSTELLGDKMLRGHGGLFGDKQISVWFYCSRFYFEQLFMSRFKDLHRIHQTPTVHYWACYSKAFLWNKTFWGCADVVDVRASLLVVESVYPRYKKQTSLLSFVLFKSKNHPERIIKAACVSQLRLNESSQPFPVGEPAIISHRAKCDLTDYPHDCLLPKGFSFS